MKALFLSVWAGAVTGFKKGLGYGVLGGWMGYLLSIPSYFDDGWWHGWRVHLLDDGRGYTLPRRQARFVVYQ
jgi:hypothetical protein